MPRLARTQGGCGIHADYRQSRSVPDLHQSRRAAEPHHPDDVPPVHPADECFQQEIGKPKSGPGAALRVLQLLPDSPDFAGHARDGGGGNGAGMGINGLNRLIAEVSPLLAEPLPNPWLQPSVSLTGIYLYD